LLHWFGHHRQIVNPEETPVKRYALVGPCAANYVEPFKKALAALRLRNPEAEKMARNGTAADTELNAPIAEHVEGRALFRDAQWM
jgi:hypothetical protein